MDWLNDASLWMQEQHTWTKWLVFLFILLIGWMASKVVQRLFLTLSSSRAIPPQVISILRPAALTVVWFFALAQALSYIGVNITSIIGAAGVLGVAIGFAAQTSLSNVICGLFIISEKTIKIGDFIRVEDVEGTVESISLLSVQLRRVDNSLIRVPNGTLIQSPVINITGNALRRCDFDIGVEYDSDLLRVREILLEVIEEQPLLANSPAPVVLFSGFADSSLNLHVGAWCKTSDYHDVRYRFAVAILAAFKRHGIGIPYPCRTIFTAEASAKKE